MKLPRILNLKVTPEQAEFIQKNAIEEGISRSEFIRTTLYTELGELLDNNPETSLFSFHLYMSTQDLIKWRTNKQKRELSLHLPKGFHKLLIKIAKAAHCTKTDLFRFLIDNALQKHIQIQHIKIKQQKPLGVKI